MFRGIERRAFRVVVATALLLGAGTFTSTPATAASCTKNILAIVAHQDDDLLFMNPDIENDVRAGACATTVFVTAGDAGAGQGYWTERERGPESAYNTMLGVAANTAWIPGQHTYANHTVRTSTSAGAGTVRLISLRIPDGALQGGGNPSNALQSLTKLWDGRIGSVNPVDGSASYTRAGLVDTLAAIVSEANPDLVRVQDARNGQIEHADHKFVGQFAQEALVGAGRATQAYRGYGVTSSPANVTGAALTRKTAALRAYAAHDPQLCGSSVCPDGVVTQWNERQYTAPLTVPSAPVPGGAPYVGPNVARNASVVASSQVVGQGATSAIDSVISGWPSNGGAEWSADGQGPGAWLQLYWPTPQTVDRVLLFDRPNANDQVTAGVLTFSDGSTVAVPTLANNGTATVVAFPARATSTLRFSVRTVSGGTENVGLAEIEVYNGDPSPSPTPSSSSPTPSSPSPSPTPSSPSPSPTPSSPSPSPSQVPVPGPAPYGGANVARNGSVLASSQAVGQGATRAIDAVVDGWPFNGGAEWSSDGQGAGAWLQLYWSGPLSVDRVVLFDRPNLSDRVMAGVLTFSDGSTVLVPALANNGTATVVTFPARVTSTLRLTVTGVSAATQNVGLAEIEVYNGDPIS